MSRKQLTHLENSPELIRILQDELAETNAEIIALTMEMEDHVAARTRELQVTQQELEKSNHELMLLTLELESRITERTIELQRFFEVSADLLCIIDPSCTFQKANRAWERTLGYASEELYQRPFLQHAHPDDVAETISVLATLAEHEVSRFANRYLCKEGGFRWLEWRAVRSDTVICASARDITEKRQAEERMGRHQEHLEELVRERTEALEQYTELLKAEILERERTELELLKAKEDAEGANRAKSSFLSSMSHEIRTPLSSILGFSELLIHDPSLHSTHRERINLIHRSGENLLELINNILEISKIEAGQVNISIENFNLPSLFYDLKAMFANKAEARGLKLSMFLSRSLPDIIASDEGKVRQILTNLIGNAIKFTSEGSVTVKAGTFFTESGQLYLTVDVIDTGMGLSKLECSNLFQVFYQTATGAQMGGTGLGLALSQKYARLLGGEISVASQPGSGSCFSLQVPSQNGENTTALAPLTNRRVVGLAPGQRPIHVLVADDRADNRLMMRDILEQVGFVVKEARDGAEAMQLYFEWNPRLIMMDLGMPVMDGYEAVRRIRRSERGSEVAIIAVTASGFDEDRDAVIKAGADDYIRKPYTQNTVLSMIQDLLGIEYAYEDSIDDRALEDHQLKTAIQSLPEGMVTDLKQAVINLDQEAMKAFVASFADDFPDLAKRLILLVQEYQYVTLMEVLNSDSLTF